ncbi:MAG: hypothetical protein LBN23_08935 [Paludibacter sp.]|jgi:phosphatidylserine synthase|nr:hypothetical protein [Paludibacter sp.]
MTKENLNNLFLAGVALVFAGAAFALFDINFAAYIFTAGAACVIAVRLLNSRRATPNFKARRLNNLQLISTLVLAVAAYFMFKNNNIWVVMLLIYALITLFLSFREK